MNLLLTLKAVHAQMEARPARHQAGQRTYPSSLEIIRRVSRREWLCQRWLAPLGRLCQS